MNYKTKRFHPDLKGRPLKVGEVWLISEWKYYRALIKFNIKKWSKHTWDKYNFPEDDDDRSGIIELLGWSWGESTEELLD